MPPCVIFEDEHLLVVNKPAGLNTHAPSPYAGEGIYDWLRNREPRWAGLAIIHRLDKETSGVVVFSKTALANRSLTAQFTNREVHKKYILLSDRPGPPKNFIARSSLHRSGDKYLSRAIHADAQTAETEFSVPALAGPPFTASLHLIEAFPKTGRTHQIRVHAAENGFPIFGDVLYGGTPAARVYLHAAELTLTHPTSGKSMTFQAPPDFSADARSLLRAAIIDPGQTNAYRLIHGASDRWPGWYVDRLGDFLLSQAEQELAAEQVRELERLMRETSVDGAGPIRACYHKARPRQERPSTAPRLLLGAQAPERFTILENGLQFELSFCEGYSTGLFLDQRDNRRRLLTSYIGPDFVLPEYGVPPLGGLPGSSCAGRLKTELHALNTFAYTCGFSVCAAKSGWHTTSLDLSKKYLDWGKRNFALNGLDPNRHDFLYGDVFDWLRRLAKKQRSFDLILLDPPTFSASKQSGVFQAQKDYGRLMTAALPLLKSSGVIFASTNAAEWAPEKFLESLQKASRSGNRKIVQLQYIPQPPDFPISRSEPAYLKMVWLRVS